MLTETRQRIDAILADRDQREHHAATVRRQLQEERAARLRHQQRRSIRGLALSGLIRR